MIGGLIVTHGRLAIELLNAAEAIVGEIDLDYLAKVRSELPALSHRKVF